MIQNVSDTALWVASYRALESERPDALFHDPLAARLVGDRGHKIARFMRNDPYVRWSVVIRTCIIDAFIRQLISQGVDTVLNLGAGMDTRPYRLELPPNLRWIEADFPRIIEPKEERLRNETPRCQLERIQLDLGDDSARTRLFSEVSAKAPKSVLVLTEGVVPYLTTAQVAALAEDLRRRFQYWILDYFSDEVLRRMQTGALKRRLKNAPILFAPANWVNFFGQHGWQVKDMRYLVEESEKLGRAIPHPWWAKILLAFAPKARREAARLGVAYAVLEPKPLDPKPPI